MDYINSCINDQETSLEKRHATLLYDLKLIQEKWKHRDIEENITLIELARAAIIDLNRENAIYFLDKGGYLPRVELSRQSYKKFVKAKLLFNFLNVDSENFINFSSHEEVILDSIKKCISNRNVGFESLSIATELSTYAISSIINIDKNRQTVKRTISDVNYFESINKTSNLGAVTNIFIDIFREYYLEITQYYRHRQNQYRKDRIALHHHQTTKMLEDRKLLRIHENPADSYSKDEIVQLDLADQRIEAMQKLIDSNKEDIKEMIVYIKELSANV
jgi:hypothetical protein